jgi:hypothetical protein
MSMRLLTLLFGFSVGAFLMRAVAPAPDAIPSCQTEPGCGVGGTAAPAPGLRVILYDPFAEPKPEEENPEPHFPGWSSAEDAGISGRSEWPARPRLSSPTGLRVEGLGQPGAQGACAVLNGKRLRCVALLTPEDE